MVEALGALFFKANSMGLISGFEAGRGGEIVTFKSWMIRFCFLLQDGKRL